MPLAMCFVRGIYLRSESCPPMATARSGADGPSGVRLRTSGWRVRWPFRSTKWCPHPTRRRPWPHTESTWCNRFSVDKNTNGKGSLPGCDKHNRMFMGWEKQHHGKRAAMFDGTIIRTDARDGGPGRVKYKTFDLLEKWQFPCQKMQSPAPCPEIFRKTS